MSPNKQARIDAAVEVYRAEEALVQAQRGLRRAQYAQIEADAEFFCPVSAYEAALQSVVDALPTDAHNRFYLTRELTAEANARYSLVQIYIKTNSADAQPDQTDYAREDSAAMIRLRDTLRVIVNEVAPQR